MTNGAQRTPDGRSVLRLTVMRWAALALAVLGAVDLYLGIVGHNGTQSFVGGSLVVGMGSPAWAQFHAARKGALRLPGGAG